MWEVGEMCGTRWMSWLHGWTVTDRPPLFASKEEGREGGKGKIGDLFTLIIQYFVFVALFSSVFCVVFRVYFLVRACVCLCVRVCVCVCS